MPGLVTEEEALAHIRWLRDQRAEGPWYRLEAKTSGKRRSAELWILDVIDPWFEDPAALVRSIARLEADDITVHLNSPGGDAFGGIAIFNALRDNPARVLTVVEGLAASAASVVAMAGDTIRMNRGAQLMIHEPSGFAFGPPDVMAKAAEMLDKVGQGIAEIYAGRAGGTAEDWREAMADESWYTAQEAVDAGLADELVADEPPEPAEPAAIARFDLARFAFAYAGRDAAPPPHMPREPSQPAMAGRKHTTKGAGMDPAKMREALGLAADAPDDEVRAALVTAGLASGAPAPPAGPPTDPPADAPADQPPPPVIPAAPTAGVIELEATQYAALRQAAMRGEEAWRKMREVECEQVLDAAIKAGKFPPARRDHWKALWAADPDGTKAQIDRLAANVIPLSEAGYAGVGAEGEIDMIYAAMYSGEKVGGSRG
jgi:ATP-dependent protease ClpP protease subunit